MKGFKTTCLGFLAVLGFVTSVWAFCDEHKNTDTASQGQAAEVAKSGQPCPHAAGDQATATGASDKKGGCSKKCPFAKAVAGSESARGPMDAVLASLPSMKYRVGEEVTECEKSAEEMAVKADKPIKYIVGETAFEKKSDATVALTKALESEIENLVAVQYVVNGKCSKCPLEAKQIAEQSNSHVVYKVAGMECCDKAKAERAAKLAADAVDSVKLSYKVGDQSFCCDKMAGVKAKETGKKITYLVGTEETCCEQTARLMLAHAKIKAIVESAAGAFSS